jgi:hypothetical protein
MLKLSIKHGSSTLHNSVHRKWFGRVSLLRNAFVKGLCLYGLFIIHLKQTIASGHQYSRNVNISICVFRIFSGGLVKRGRERITASLEETSSKITVLHADNIFVVFSWKLIDCLYIYFRNSKLRLFFLFPKLTDRMHSSLLRVSQV